MANKRLLINREWHISGTWNAPRNFLREKFASVVFCDHINTSSSAGNWEGLILQRFGKKLYAVLFSQENCFPRDGFTLSTSETPFIQFPDIGESPNYRELFNEAANAIYEMYYQM